MINRFIKPHYKLLSIFLLSGILLLSSFKISLSQETEIINSLDEALSLALKNNSAVITAKLDKLQAEQKVSEVYSQNLVPTLTLNSRYQRAIKKQVFYIAGQRLEIGSDNSLTNTVDATQSLPILGTPVFSGIRIAEYYLRVKEEGILAAANDVKNNVRNSYFSVLLSKAVLDVNRLTLQNAQDNLKVVEAKYRNGVATEFDYLRAQVRVDNSAPVLTKSERNYDLSRKALLNSIGLKSIRDLEVSGTLTYDSNEVWGNTDYVINQVSENYVAVRQLNINRKINEELVRVDKANFLPKLYLFGQYALSSSENDGRPINDYRFFNTLNLGMGLSWDLNLFRNSFKVNQSEIEVKKNEEQIRDLQQKLRLTAESSIIALEDAKERILSQQKTVALAERSLELANASYRAGALNQIDVQSAELSLSESRLAYLQAIYDYQIAKAGIQKLLEK